MRWSVGQGLGLLGRQLQAPSDRPGSGKVGDGTLRSPYFFASICSRRALIAASAWGSEAAQSSPMGLSTVMSG